MSVSGWPSSRVIISVHFMQYLYLTQKYMMRYEEILKHPDSIVAVKN